MATLGQLWAWECEGKTEYGYEISRGFEGIRRFVRVDNPHGRGLLRGERFITNLRKVKVVDEDAIVLDPHLLVKGLTDGEFDTYVLKTKPKPITKTYLTTDQFIKVYKSLSNEKSRKLYAAWIEARNATWYATWYAAWSAAWTADWNAAWTADWTADWIEAWNADLAILVKEKITAEQFEILTSPWTSCGLSLYAEDWQDVLAPKVEEPKNFGAIVEAETANWVNRRKFVKLMGVDDPIWFGEKEQSYFIWSDLINPIIISEGVEG